MSKEKRESFTVGSSKLEDFYGWINERHLIYTRRSGGMTKPWSDDPIFQTYKFTNAFRELDTGTIALRKMESAALAELDAETDPDRALTYCKLFVFNTFWYRIFNWHEHARDLGFVDSFDKADHYFRNCQRTGKRIFTGAHMVRGDNGETKVYPYLRLLKQVWDGLEQLTWGIIRGGNLHAAFVRVIEFHLMGGFTSYEIVSDLRWNILRDAPDILTWGNVGPGAKRGMLRLGFQPSTESMVELHRLAPKYLCAAVKAHYGNRAIWPPFEVREIEHSLCEFDKYARVKMGQGRPRSTYPGA